MPPPEAVGIYVLLVAGARPRVSQELSELTPGLLAAVESGAEYLVRVLEFEGLRVLQPQEATDLLLEVARRTAE
jgi:hypothetical protein